MNTNTFSNVGESNINQTGATSTSDPKSDFSKLDTPLAPSTPGLTPQPAVSNTGASQPGPSDDFYATLEEPSPDITPELTPKAKKMDKIRSLAGDVSDAKPREAEQKEPPNALNELATGKKDVKDEDAGKATKDKNKKQKQAGRGEWVTGVVG